VLLSLIAWTTQPIVPDQNQLVWTSDDNPFRHALAFNELHRNSTSSSIPATSSWKR
jgi:hypothetical protein